MEHLSSTPLVLYHWCWWHGIYLKLKNFYPIEAYWRLKKVWWSGVWLRIADIFGLDTRGTSTINYQLSYAPSSVYLKVTPKQETQAGNCSLTHWHGGDDENNYDAGWGGRADMQARHECPTSVTSLPVSLSPTYFISVSTPALFQFSFSWVKAHTTCTYILQLIWIIS